VGKNKSETVFSESTGLILIADQRFIHRGWRDAGLGVQPVEKVRKTGRMPVRRQ
jgi:hypothetical protein